MKNAYDWDSYPAMLLTKEVALLLRCTPLTVKRYLESEKLKGKKCGNKWLVSKRYLMKTFDNI